jgi:aminopeptidase N
MKNLFLLILLASGKLLAQNTIDAKTFQKEMEMVRQQEQQAYERLLTNQPQGVSFTVASSNFDIHHTRMDWYIDPALNYISGKITFDFRITENSNTITLDLLQQLVVDSIYYHGNKIAFAQTPDNGLIITFPSILNANSKDSVSVFYQGVPGGGGFGSFYQGKHAGVPVIYTLSEPYGAREWWPCKNNLLDKTDSIDIYITCPKEYQPSSNGVMVNNDINGAFRTSYFKHRFPISTYLVAIAVTNYVFNNDTVQVGNKSYPFQSYFYPESAGALIPREIYCKMAYRTFSKLIGEYPFASEKYGHTQWGWGGGMEHQTNSFINSAGPVLMAHELAHQWFGDLITCGSWKDIWLNEGFATYMSMIFNEVDFPSFFRPTLESALNQIVSDSTGSVYVDDTTSESRIFSGRLSYNKGAYVLHMLRGMLGDSTFFRGVRRYTNDAAVKLSFAFTDDLKRNLELESGKDLTEFFQNWIYGQGYPNYHADWYQNNKNWVKVKLKQTTSHPSVAFYKMPVTLLLRGASQGASFIVDHKYSGEEFWINAGFPVDTVIIDPDIWILSKIKTSTKLTPPVGDNNIKVFPNPGTGPLYISLTNPTDKTLYLTVFNSLGQKVYTTKKDTPGQDELFSVPATVLSRGVYFIEIRSEKSIKLVKKIVR